MIRIINRSMSIPIPDRVIGHVGDNLVETRSFELNRYYGEVDLSEFSFKLDTEIDGNKNIIDLDKTVEDDKITLTWTVHGSHVLHVGRMAIQIRAFHDGVEKWHSAQGYVIIQSSINAPDAYSSLLPSEFEQMELRVTTLKEQAEASAQTATEQANRAQGIADAFENTTLPAAIQSVEGAVQEQIGIAKGHADRAQGIADEFENETLPAAIAAVEAAVDEQVDIAASHADRAQGIADTFSNTTLPAAISAVEAAGQAKVDLAEQQAERVEDIIREAEQDVLPELRQAIEDGIETKDQLGGSIQEAGEAKTALDGSISSAGTAKGELDGSITEANTAKGQLDDSIDLAGNAKTELDGSITTAEQTKQALDESIATGDLANFKTEFQSHKNDYATYKDSNSLKLAKVEKDLKDYQQTLNQVNINQEAKQTASGYGTISLPKNAANGQISDVVLGGMTAHNLIVNGGFATNITGWTLRSCTLTSVGGVAEMTGQESGYGSNRAYQNHGVPEGNKWYASADVKATTNLAGIGIPTATRLASHSGSGNWERLSFVRTRTTDTAIALIDNRTSGWDTVYFDNVLVVDLTATFGAGNEPSKEEMDALTANWFDGLKSVVAPRVRSVDADGNNPSLLYPEPVTLRRLPNGVRDTIEGGKLIRKVGERVIQESDIFYFRSRNNVNSVQMNRPADCIPFVASVQGGVHIPTKTQYADATFNALPADSPYINNYLTTPDGGGLICFIFNKTVTSLEQAKSLLAGLTLLYELADPEITENITSGVLTSHPSGTIYLEHALADAGMYTDKMTVLRADFPIERLESIHKVDPVTGGLVPLYISEALVAEDGLSFTHSELTEGDIVFFVYHYPYSGPNGENSYSYYDSRYVIADSSNGKHYKWQVSSTDGVPSIELVEV